MPAYVAYLRDSGGDAQDLSIPEQTAVLSAYCADRSLTLLHIYQDVAAPGSSVIGRRQFTQMVTDLRTNHYPDCAGVLVWNYSRFSRDIDDAQYYKSDLRRRGYEIRSLNDNVPDGLDGRVFEALLDWKNAKYLADLSVDVRRGLQHNLHQFGAVPGIPPRGFRFGPPINVGQRRNGKTHYVHRWEPDPDQVPIIQRAFHLRSLEKSYTEITAACGLYRSSSGWNHFFANPIYKGELRYGGAVIPDYCTPIIDPATWDVVQEINSRTITRRVTLMDHPRRASSSYMLSGLLTCARCGAPLNGETIYSKKKDHVNRYYGCSLKRRTHAADCDALYIPQAALESVVLTAISDHIYTTGNIESIRASLASMDSTSAADISAQLQDRTKYLGSIRAKITNVVTAIESSPDSAALVSRLAELEQLEREVKAHIGRLTLQVNRPDTTTDPALVVKSIRAALQADPAELRVKLRVLIHHIEAQRLDNRVIATIYYFLPDEFMCMDMSRRGGRIYTHKLIYNLRQLALVQVPVGHIPSGG